MRPSEQDALRELIRQWTCKAEQDILAAESLLAGELPLPYPVCFHSQQAAEKYLKAFLTLHQIEFPKTHSIRELLDLVRNRSPHLADDLAGAVSLTPYGVDVRYPGDIPEPTRSQAEEAVGLARKVRAAVLRAMPSA